MCTMDYVSHVLGLQGWERAYFAGEDEDAYFAGEEDSCETSCNKSARVWATAVPALRCADAISAGGAATLQLATAECRSRARALQVRQKK